MLLYQEDAELLFPPRLIPALRDLRGEEFSSLVEQVMASTVEGSSDKLGFILMMIRLANCVSCTADSYRAMNGCTRCATRTVRGFRGSDAELVSMWQAACQDIEAWLETKVAPQD